MKVARLPRKVASFEVFLVMLAILFSFSTGTANSASEPGTVTIVLSGEPIILDPGHVSQNFVAQVLMRNILETLTEMNPADSSIIPRLATSWKQIDANTWHFFLRKGVKFHDGADFNAEAVMFNLKRIHEKSLKSTIGARLFAGFKMDAKALDSHTVEFKTDRPEPLLPNLMATLTLCSPNTPLDKLTQNPVGTGPYRFVKWDRGTQIISERFDGYWGKQPQIKKAVYLWRTESSVRAAMVLLGEADLAPDIAKQDANRPDMDYSFLNSETTNLRIGGEWDPPLNDRRVRMALNYAVDRDAIRGSILSKDVIPATQLIVPNILGYNPDLKPWPYDPQKARQVLDEARKDGVPVDKEILLIGRIGNFPGVGELMEALMAMYKAVGLNVKLKMVEQGVHRTYQQRPFPTNAGLYILQHMHDNSKGDATFTVLINYRCNGWQSSMCDKQVDDLIDKAQVATGEERRKLWQAAFKRMHEEIIPGVVLFHMVGYCRVGKRISFKPSIITSNELQLAEISFRQ